MPQTLPTLTDLLNPLPQAAHVYIYAIDQCSKIHQSNFTCIADEKNVPFSGHAYTIGNQQNVIKSHPTKPKVHIHPLSN